jgi:hypothetical protein
MVKLEIMQADIGAPVRVILDGKPLEYVTRLSVDVDANTDKIVRVSMDFIPNDVVITVCPEEIEGV